MQRLELHDCCTDIGRLIQETHQRIAALHQARRHGEQREALRIERDVHLFPVERSRDRGARPRAYGVRRDDGARRSGLADVDQRLAAAFVDATLERAELWVARDDELTEELAEELRRLEADAGAERNEHMQPLLPR